MSITPNDVTIAISKDRDELGDKTCTITVGNVGSITVRYFPLFILNNVDHFGNCEITVSGNLNGERQGAIATFITALLMAGVDIDKHEFKWALLSALDLLGR